MNRLATIRRFLLGKPKNLTQTFDYFKPKGLNPLPKLKAENLNGPRAALGRFLQNETKIRQQLVLASANSMLSQHLSRKLHNSEKPIYLYQKRQMFATKSPASSSPNPNPSGGGSPAPVTSPGRENQTKNPDDGQKGDSRVRANRYETERQALDGLISRGYKLQFRITNDGNLRAHDGDKELSKSYTADQVQADEFHRFEGASNPSDMVIIYALSTDDKLKGTLHVPFGAGQENEHTGDFVRQLNLKARAKQQH